jgi:hypothetical protein
MPGKPGLFRLYRHAIDGHRTKFRTKPSSFCGIDGTGALDRCAAHGLRT